MTQYVIQIQNVENGSSRISLGIGWLAKSFEVTSECPIPTDFPSSRIQILLTNTAGFNAIVAVYNEHTTDVVFTYDQPGGTINCTGAVTNSWPID